MSEGNATDEGNDGGLRVKRLSSKTRRIKMMRIGQRKT